MDEIEVTGQGENNQENPPPPPAPQPEAEVPVNHLAQLTQTIIEMRQELIINRNQMCEINTKNNDGNNPNPNPPPQPVRKIRNSSLKYYPDIDKLCKSLYLDGPDMMESKTAIEWLKSLHTLAAILRCSWILETPPQRPDDVTYG